MYHEAFHLPCFNQVSGPMVIMITEIVKDMMVFSFLLLLVVIGFGIAFYVLFSLDPGSRSGEGDEGDEGDGGDEGGDDETGFETLQRSLLSMFTLMLGDFEIDVSKSNWSMLRSNLLLFSRSADTCIWLISSLPN